MLVYAVDLGTTNVKVVLYDRTARALATFRTPVTYRREGVRVEFDAEGLFETVLDLIRRCAAHAPADHAAPAQIVVTGQAESLVIVDASGRSVIPGISWMDERSAEEAREIAERFDDGAAFAVTGEPAAVATWPATKLRWLSRHQPEVLTRSSRVLMVKDYVLLRLTGVAVGEETTRGFTYLYDVPRRTYWTEMIDFCGARVDALPEVVPAGTGIGPVLPEIAESLPPASSYTVNVGALDHFCTMLGTGSYRSGVLSASAGTVLALSALAAPDWRFDPASRVSFHPGLRTGETILFTCADSGGVSLDWLRQMISPGLTYDELAAQLPARSQSDAPIFLPYLTGLNPPDFNASARGAFVGLELRHDRVDLSYSVMEGVAHLLRRNVDDMVHHGEPIHELVSAGGGTASTFWNQLKADVVGLDFRVPDETEAASRGAALLALADAGVIDSIDDVSHLHWPDERIFHPSGDAVRGARYSAFESALQRLYGP